MLKIENRNIGRDNQPFVIAEMSGNHNQSLDRALDIVTAAAKSGVDAIKIQTYTADTMTINIDDDEFRVNESDSIWEGQLLYELYQKAYTPWEWHKPIFELCKDLGIIGFSTPFDETAVDFLETLNVPCYKIASQENTDLPLIKKVAATGKPLIISTGMASVSELDEAVRTARNAGCKNLTLLKCSSTYPASPENTNLLTIPHLRTLFNTEVGLSDHTLGIGVSIAAIALGASVIEKHFTLKRSDGGVDSVFSMEPEEMRQLVLETKQAWFSLGKTLYGPTSKENNALKYRRSLYIVEDIREGEIITKNNIRAIRPGFGLPTKYIEVFLGKKVAMDTKKGTPVSWSLLG